MSGSVKDIDSAITSDFVRRIGPDRYELWFADRRAIRYRDGKLVVTLTDQFALERVRTQFGGDIEAVARKRIGDGLSIVYELGENENAKTPSKQHKPVIAAQPRGKRSSTSRFDLSRFQFGAHNALAQTAVNELLSRPGKTSPIVISGPIGSGKTHLLQGSVWAARASSRFRRCVYLSAEQFVANFVEALEGRGVPIFRRKCRGLDLFALDDLQFFKGKRATLVELQHTVDALLRDGKQLIFAADRPLVDLAFLGPELSNRLSSGLTCAVEYPSYEGRLEVLKQIVAQRQQSVASAVLQFVAQQLAGDVRQLFGAVNLICAAQTATGRAATVDSCKSMLRDLFQSNRRFVSMDQIESAVCGVCGVQPNELKSSLRSKRVSSARMLAMFLSRKLTSAAYSEIGQYFGGRSHSTVISAQRKVLNWMKNNQSVPVSQSACEIDEAIRRIESQLRAG